MIEPNKWVVSSDAQEFDPKARQTFWNEEPMVDTILG